MPLKHTGGLLALHDMLQFQVMHFVFGRILCQIVALLSETIALAHTKFRTSSDYQPWLQIHLR